MEPEFIQIFQLMHLQIDEWRNHFCINGNGMIIFITDLRSNANSLSGMEGLFC